jgi:LPS O-antigen subunit length determinant protein (WzzB/FepE family)
MENNKNMLEEFNIYYLLKNLWTNRKTLIICISFFAVSSIIYSLVVDQEFEVTAVIKPADANQETTLSDNAPIMGVGIGGTATFPLINDIMITLKSDSFLEKLLNKYINEQAVLGDKINKTLDKIDDPKEKEYMKRYIGLKILRKSIDFSFDSDQNTINLKVTTKDKLVSFNMMNDLLDYLRTYLKDQNSSNLESDIQYFKELTEKADDPKIIELLNKKLAEKIERKFNLSSNIFIVTDKPAVPAKRSFPKRSFIVIMTTGIGFLISALAVSLIPQFKKIINLIKEK